MRTVCIVAVAIVILVATGITHGQASLDKEATLDILKQLTSGKRTTWIAAGTLEAGHQRFRAAQTTDEAEIAGAIAQATRDYESQTEKIERTAELQAMRREAIPFNVRYKLANE